MAAFTTFESSALERYLVMFGKGELSGYEAISGGIENSNYFVTLLQDGQPTEYVLTIIENLSFNDVPFFNKLVSRLQHYGLPVAAPETTLDGMSSTIFCGKPAFLVRRLAGRHPRDVNAGQCEQIGIYIAQSHAAAADLDASRDNPYSPAWMRDTIAQIGSLSPEQRNQLMQSVQAYERILAMSLPVGLIHGDLFRDNTLFLDDGQLSGVIDFYHACQDLLIQDLAVVLNDWCADASQSINRALSDALISGYESVRPLSDEEKKALPELQQITACRFALTRFTSGSPPLKDPYEMLALAERL